ncbi:tyrosine-type recombinase/integrase, partial [Muribaculum intestinale]
MKSSDIPEITRNINRDIRLLERIIRTLSDRAVTFDADDITERFNRTTTENSLFNFMNATINRLIQNGRIRTSETYTAALRSFRKFREGRDIPLDELDTDTIEAYEAFLRANGLVPNSISFYMRILRALYNRAVEAGITQQQKPFRHVYTGIDKTVKRALPISKIRQLRNLELSQSPALAYARDIFMLSFYLRGMSFIDMAFLRKTDLHNNRITYRRHKTGQQLTIACTPEMKTILNRYPGNASEYLLPIIPSNVTDERKAYRNQSYSINRRLKQIAVMLDITTPLTLYVA